MATTRRKAATNLSLRVDLVQRARVLQLNLSELVEAALETAIQSVEQTRWLEQNQEAIREYNAFVEENGVFSDDWRQF